MYLKIDNAKGIVMTLFKQSMVQHFSDLNWKITEDYIIDLTWEIIDSLREIHSHGIVHWDIKPENIMFNDDEEAQVIDFSYSRFIDKEQIDSATQNSAIFEGTIYYSARLGMGK